MPSYGLVLEGSYDTPVFRYLTERMDSPDARVYVRECGGIGNLRSKLTGFLQSLEGADFGQPVDRAIVIADTGPKGARELEEELRSLLAGKQFKFPQGVEICAVRQETEAWLLADETAISTVARTRGGQNVGYFPQNPEDVVNPKERLQQILNRAGLSYTPQVLGEISKVASLNTLHYRLACYRRFAEIVNFGQAGVTEV